MKHLNEQQYEADSLRKQIVKANSDLVFANQIAQDTMKQVVESEKIKAAEERRNLLVQVTSLINATAEAQDTRMTDHVLTIGQDLSAARAAHATAHETYGQGMDAWSEKSKELVNKVTKSRDGVKTKIKADFAVSCIYPYPGHILIVIIARLLTTIPPLYVQQQPPFMTRLCVSSQARWRTWKLSCKRLMRSSHVSAPKTTLITPHMYPPYQISVLQFRTPTPALVTILLLHSHVFRSSGQT